VQKESKLEIHIVGKVKALVHYVKRHKGFGMWECSDGCDIMIQRYRSNELKINTTIQTPLKKVPLESKKGV